MITDFTTVVSLGSLLTAWTEFSRGKRSKPDVQDFERNLMDNLMVLHADLMAGTYCHGPYQEFKINDPKPRKISKATIRDRVVHHALHAALYPHFNNRFIPDSFSCRVGKGTHAGSDRFAAMAIQATKNNTQQAWVLKCDVRQFFASIDHETILNIVRRDVTDDRLMDLVTRVVRSFEANLGKGLPLGNLTSQLLANVYMNEFDQFVKHSLGEKSYIRYADDFLIISQSRDHLERTLPKVRDFLLNKLGLELHPAKVSIGTVAAGVDFLGWTHFPQYRTIRRVTKDRMIRRLKSTPTPETIQSYLGLLKHGNAFNISRYVAGVQELYQV